MQASGTSVKPKIRHGGWVFGEDRCVVKVALAESDAAPVFEINCRDQQHVIIEWSRKVQSTRNKRALIRG